MNVDPARAAATVIHRQDLLLLLARLHAEKFKADPQKYLSHRNSLRLRPATAATVVADLPGPAVPQSATLAYVCPMDPEIRQDHPGPCPKCGMALEPEIPDRSGKTQWTCPMHPEIVRDEPGRVSHLRHGAGAHDRHRRGTKKIPSCAR